MTALLRGSMLCFACMITLAEMGAAEVRIKDITQIEGVRSNKVYGLGLVVGLNGTGARALSTQQMAIDMLRKLEMTTKLARQAITDNVYKSPNIAMVMVTADLPPFARKGSEMDVVVNVADDSMSLEGGTLLQTPLRGADGEVYVVAQGQLSIGGFRIRSSANTAQLNHPTVARAINGGIVEREALGSIDQGGFVRLLLRQAEFETARSVTHAVNAFCPLAARTIDSGTIQIQIPMNRRLDVPDFVSEIGLLKILPDAPARVVINERTGTVIVGHKVRISSIAIAHGNLVIKPNVSLVPTASAQTPPETPPPPPPESDDPVDGVIDALRPKALPKQEQPEAPLALHNVEQTFTVADLARILNALGVSPRDLIAIFQALKESGALHADLVLI